ncbi:hypothetical protein QCA50_020365 [Cerrena zonata]|uniref:Uncharacterized protein n=1 Tax=Cerrena zonata TaxID=2478898 RepID=A0AAW0FGJ8_9APHY
MHITDTWVAVIRIGVLEIYVHDMFDYTFWQDLYLSHSVGSAFFSKVSSRKLKDRPRECHHSTLSQGIVGVSGKSVSWIYGDMEQAYPNPPFPYWQFLEHIKSDIVHFWKANRFANPPPGWLNVFEGVAANGHT